MDPVCEHSVYWGAGKGGNEAEEGTRVGGTALDGGIDGRPASSCLLALGAVRTDGHRYAFVMAAWCLCGTVCDGGRQRRVPAAKPAATNGRYVQVCVIAHAAN